MKLIPGHDTIRTIPGLKLHFLRLFYSLKIFGFSEKKSSYSVFYSICLLQIVPFLLVNIKIKIGPNFMGFFFFYHKPTLFSFLFPNLSAF